jgi:hypothetical protein
LIEDGPKIAIPSNLRGPIRKNSEKEIMDEKFYNGEAMETLKDCLDDNMLEGDYLLKNKIEKERILFNEKKHRR